MIFQIALFVLLVSVIVIPLQWRTCVKLVLVIVVVEGAIRKWVLPGASQFIYFFKDFLVLAAYLKFFSRSGLPPVTEPSERRFRGLMTMSMIFIGLEIMNWNLGSPLLGVFGARNYLLYIPLVYLIRDLFRSRAELVTFVQRYLLLVIPVALLAVKQHISPPDSFWNIYARNEDIGTAMIGQAVRVTGTFSYIAGFSSFLQTAAALTIPLLILELPPIWKWMMRTVFVSIIASILLTGSRGPILVMGAFLISYFLLNRNFRYYRLYRKLLIPVSAFAIIGLGWMGPQISLFVGRGAGGSDLLPRMLDALTQPVRSITDVGVAGYGVGSAYQAADVIRETFGLPLGNPIPVFLESEPQRVMYEIGPFGFALWYLLRLSLIAALWRTYLRAQVPLYRELALTACLIHATSLTSQMVFQITFMVYYWFLAGFVLLLPRLERLEQEYSPERELSELRENSWGGAVRQ